MNFRYIKGIKTNKMSLQSAIKPHVKEPLDVPKVQGPMEIECQIIFAGQTNAMLKDLIDKMVEIKK